MKPERESTTKELLLFYSLRLTRLNDEIGLNDEFNGEDETYKDVMKDFSNFAASQPRMLRQRNDSNTLESQRSSLTNSD